MLIIINSNTEQLENTTQYKVVIHNLLYGNIVQQIKKIYLIIYFLKIILLIKVNYKIYNKEILAIIRVLE